MIGVKRLRSSLGIEIEVRRGKDSERLVRLVFVRPEERRNGFCSWLCTCWRRDRQGVSRKTGELFFSRTDLEWRRLKELWETVHDAFPPMSWVDDVAYVAGTDISGVVRAQGFEPWTY